MMLALVKQDVDQDVRRAIDKRFAVNVHVPGRDQFAFAEGIEVGSGVIPNTASVGLELVPGRHSLHGSIARAMRVRKPANVRPVDVPQRIGQGRPTRPGCRLHE